MSAPRRPAAGWPKLLTSLRGTDRRTALADLVAGVTVGLVALPLAMAFAIASGAPAAGRHLLRHRHRLPDLGARRLARARSAGPPARSSSSSPGIVAQHGVDGLFMCTMMAGVLLVVLGAHRHRHRR